MNILRVLLLLLIVLPSAAEAQKKVNLRFNWTPVSGALSQRIVVKEVADGAWYYPPTEYVDVANTVNSFDYTASNRYWISFHLQALTSPTGGGTTISNFLLDEPDMLYPTLRTGGPTNLTTTVLGVVDDTNYEPDNIVLTDSSGGEGGHIIFKTPLSKYRQNTPDSHLVRPLADVSKANDPAFSPSDIEFIEVRNAGTKPVTVITATAVNAQFVSVRPSASPAQPVIIEPGKRQLFEIWFWPLHFNFAHYDFAPEAGPIGPNTPQVVIVTADAAMLQVAIEGHSTFDADINYDGKVNLGDLGVLRANYLKTTTSPDWDPTADINQDGTINLGDYGLLRAQFGDER